MMGSRKELALPVFPPDQLFLEHSHHLPPAPHQ